MGVDDAEVAEDVVDPEAPEVEDQAVEEALAGEETSQEEEPAAPSAPSAPSAPPAPPGMSPQDLAAAFQQAIQPLVPRLPQEKKWWDDPKSMHERMLSNPEKFHSGFHEVLKHAIGQEVGPLRDVIQKQNEIISYLYARSPEREDFGRISERADQIAKDYGVPYRTALRMATDDASRAGAKAPPAGKQVKSPPRHASSPDTRQGARLPAKREGKSLDFREIMKEVNAERGD